MGKSILLADDSATIRKVVELTFSDTGFHVEAVASGAEALERLELLQPDVVLADVVMPGPTGYEICRQLKRSARPVPVLLLAGAFETFDHELARECGADGCLMKPFESKTLLERVESLLARPPLAVPPPPVDEPPDLDSLAGDDAEEVPVEMARGGPERPSVPDLSAESVDAIARAVVERLSADVIRQIAREVVPRVAEQLVRQRIRELEGEDDPGGDRSDGA